MWYKSIWPLRVQHISRIAQSAATMGRGRKRKKKGNWVNPPLRSPPKRRKHVDRPLGEKVRIAERVVVGGERVIDVCRQESISQSTLSTWKKELPNYKAQLESSALSRDKLRCRPSKHPFVERAMVEWIADVRASKQFNNMISGDQLFAVAKR